MKLRLKRILIPLIWAGIGIYFLLFLAAAFMFPGGSAFDACQSGFSFFHNYWCDLMGSVCEIGVKNDARPLAVTGHLIMSGTMMIVFYVMPFLFEKQNRNARLTRFFGFLAMAAMMFVFTDLHDRVIIFVALSGTVALLPFFMELEKSNHLFLRRYAYFCFVCCVVIFTVYETGFLIYWLPLLQKVVLLICVGWILQMTRTVKPVLAI